MTKKRYTKKKYGGQSTFEMGLASYIRHLLDYTTDQGHWIVDLDGFTFSDGSQPTARWIVNRIIHNYQKGTEGSDFFGKRFENSKKAIEFLAEILRRIKGRLVVSELDDDETDGGIYTRESFSLLVDNAIQMIEDNNRGTQVVASDAVVKSSKAPKEKISDAVLISLVNAKTKELQNKSVNDNITINGLNSKVSQLSTQTEQLSRKLKLAEDQNNKLSRELETLKPIVQPKKTEPIVQQIEPIVQQTEPIVQQTEPFVQPKKTEPNLQQTEPIVQQTEPIVQETSQSPPPPPVVLESKTIELPKPDEQSEKKALMEKKRAEIQANLAKARKEQEEKEKQDKIRSALGALGRIPLSREDLIKNLFKTPKNYTDKQIEDLQTKLQIERLGVSLFLNMSANSEDPENMKFIENMLENNIRNDPYKLVVLGDSVVFNEGTSVINILETASNLILNTWLTDLWKVEQDVYKYKFNSFVSGKTLFKSLIPALTAYNKNKSEENDKEVRRLLDDFVEETNEYRFTNLIASSWYSFGCIFALNPINIGDFLNKLYYYEKNTKFGSKGIKSVETTIEFFKNENYRMYSISLEGIIESILKIMNQTVQNISDKTQPTTDTDTFLYLYLKFLKNSNIFSMFLIYNSYLSVVHNKRVVWRNLLILNGEMKKWITEWGSKIDTKRLKIMQDFSYSIDAIINYSGVDPIIKEVIEENLSATEPSGAKPPGTEPPGGGLTRKKGGKKRRTHKKKRRS